MRKNANANTNHASKVKLTRQTGRNEMVMLMLMVIMMIGDERREGETNEHAMQEESKVMTGREGNTRSL